MPDVSSNPSSMILPSQIGPLTLGMCHGTQVLADGNKQATALIKNVGVSEQPGTTLTGNQNQAQRSSLEPLTLERSGYW